MDGKPRLNEIEQTAATWLIRRDREEWSDADQAELDRWLASSPSHRVSYIRQLSIWREADRLTSLRLAVPEGQVPARGLIERSPFFAIRRKDVEAASSSAGQALVEETDKTAEMSVNTDIQAPPAVLDVKSSPQTHWRSHRLKGYTAAAVVLLVIGIYAVGFASSGQSFSTPVGGLSTVPTADGSSITLNTNTEIQVRFSENERRIELKRGEAFFDVAKDPSRPFVVYAQDQRVVAVGTQFSVRLDSKAVHVAVAEGKVRLEDQPTLLDLTRFTTSSSKTISPERKARLAVAGTIADVRQRHISVNPLPMRDIEQALSWRSGYVALDKTPLADAVAEFNRYNTRQLRIADPALEDIRVGGNFRSTNVEGFVRLLDQGFGVEANAQDDVIFLRKKR